jgi:hypothetical protein
LPAAGSDCPSPLDRRSAARWESIVQNHADSRGPIISLLNCRVVAVEHLAYAPGAEAVIKADGPNNTAVTRHTDLKAAKQDFDLANGATAMISRWNRWRDSVWVGRTVLCAPPMCCRRWEAPSEKSEVRNPN